MQNVMFRKVSQEIYITSALHKLSLPFHWRNLGLSRFHPIASLPLFQCTWSKKLCWLVLPSYCHRNWSMSMGMQVQESTGLLSSLGENNNLDEYFKRNSGRYLCSNRIKSW